MMFRYIKITLVRVLSTGVGLVKKFPPPKPSVIVLLPQSVYSGLQYSCHTPGREVVKD